MKTGKYLPQILFSSLFISTYGRGIGQGTVNAASLPARFLNSDPAARSETTGTSVHWNYDIFSRNGPFGWGEHFPNCNGNRQSPIDIDTLRVRYNVPYRVRYMKPNFSTVSGEMVNNGHAPTFQLDSTSSRQYYLRGVPNHVTETYVLQQFHVHFHGSSDKGSEHTVNERRYDGELHLVHYNKKYGSFAKASTHSDGLVVIAVFLEVGRRPNAEISQIIDSFAKVSHLASKRDITYPSLNFLNLNFDAFYTYQGSLTTPTCLETVTWIVLKDELHVTSSNMAILRQLETEHNLKIARDGNVRPTQSRNGRIVEANFGSVRRHDDDDDD